MLTLAIAVGMACRTPYPGDAQAFGDVVPLRATGKGHLLVQADAGGTPIWLLLDTGATGSCLTTQAADRLKLKPVGGTGSVHVGDGRRIVSRYYSLPRLALGRCADHRLLLEAADLALVSRCAADLGITVDGVLGAELLRRFNAVIDYGRRELRLLPVWAGDLAALQGEWVGTDFEDDGSAPTALTRENVRGVRLVVRGDHMTLDQKVAGLQQLTQRLDLQPEHTPKRWVSRQPAFGGVPLPGEDVGTMGLYELAGDRLKFLISTRYKTEDDLPSRMTAKVANSRFMLFTFTKLAGGQGLVRRAVGHLYLSEHFARWSGWQYAVTPDWSLTGTNTARRLRFTARLDGTVKFEPLRP